MNCLKYPSSVLTFYINNIVAFSYRSINTMPQSDENVLKDWINPIILLHFKAIIRIACPPQ